MLTRAHATGEDATPADANPERLQPDSLGRAHRTGTLSDHEMPDPYYGGEVGFEQVLDLAEQASRGLLEELRRKLSPYRKAP